MAITHGRVVASWSMSEIHAAEQVRTPAEVSGLRAAAELRRDSSEYMRVRCGAVLATLDWIAGLSVIGPATGERRLPDEIIERVGYSPTGMHVEQVQAEDLERSLVGRGDEHVWPGVVAQTLRWYQHRRRTEAPVL